MEERDLYYAKEYHQRLIMASTQEHQLKTRKASLPNLKDYLLNRTGNMLILLGRRLQSASLHQYEGHADLTSECA